MGIKCLQNSIETDIIFQANIFEIYTDLSSYVCVYMYVYDVLCDFPIFHREKYGILMHYKILIPPSHYTLIYQNIFSRKWLSSKNSKLWATFCLCISVSFKVGCKASMGLTEFLTIAGWRLFTFRESDSILKTGQ